MTTSPNPALYGFANDDVVISGMSMSFPGCPDYTHFKHTLMNSLRFMGSKMETQVGLRPYLNDQSRVIRHARTFDHVLFGTPKSLAARFASTSLKGVERSTEALMDAGVHPNDVKDIICHVIGGVWFIDAEFSDVRFDGAKYELTGRSRTMFPNRISFFHDAKGSSIAVDGGYSSGMLLLQNSYQELSKGRADMVVVCAGNDVHDGNFALKMGDLGWISKDGKVRCFDNEATGFVRSEGTAAFVLQRACDAKRIYAKIRHINLLSLQKDYFSIPTEENWKTILKGVSLENNFSEKDIVYYEAYGAGVKEWDTVELNAVADALCDGRINPLLIGSVKSNLGNAEAVGDFASVIKAIICFEEGRIPPNIDFSEPNKDVPALQDGRLKVVDTLQSFPKNGLVAIGSMSFGGVYGNCVLECFPKEKTSCENPPLPYIVPVTTRIEDFMDDHLRILEKMPFDPEFIALHNEVFSRKIERFLGRGFTLLPVQDEPINYKTTYNGEKRPLWFVFSGMGSQWVGMGKSIMLIPLCRESIEKCHNVLLPFGVNLIEIITSEDSTIFDNILHCFVGITAIQIALVDLMLALKLEPDGLIGHSVGELGCSYADRCLTAEQTILCSYYRGSALNEATLERGNMAAVGKGYEEIKNELPKDVEVACHNSKSSCTLSGKQAAVKDYVQELIKRGVFARTVNAGNIAYHSSFIRPAAPLLLKYLKEVIKEPKLRSAKWICSSMPESLWGTDDARYCSAQYHTNNLLNSVLFEEASLHIPQDAVLVEIAPHGLLQAILKRSMPPTSTNIPLTNRTVKRPFEFLLGSIGKIFSVGFDLDMTILSPKVQYPVSRRTGQLHSFLKIMQDPVPPIEDNSYKLRLKLHNVYKEIDPELNVHSIADLKILPMAMYALLAVKTHEAYFKTKWNSKGSFAVTGLRLENPIVASMEVKTYAESVTLPKSGCFEIEYNGELLVSGSFSEAQPQHLNLVPPAAETLLTLKREDIYNWFERRGFHFSQHLQPLLSANITRNGSCGRIKWTDSWFLKMEALLQLKMLGVCQDMESLQFPCYIEQFELYDATIPQTTELELCYDRRTNLLSCPGIRLSGVKFRPLHVDAACKFNLFTNETVPYNNGFKKKEDFLHFCISLMKTLDSKENWGQNFSVIEIAHEHWPSISTWLPPNIPFSSVVKADDRILREKTLAVCAADQLALLASSSAQFVLVQSDSSAPLRPPDEFAIVSAFKNSSKEEHLVFIKKKITLNGEADFMTFSGSEFALLSALRKRQLTKTSALIVAYHVPHEGIPQFQRRIQSSLNLNLKWMFILDSDAPKFSVSIKLYEEQLVKGLRTNILLDGSWHCPYTSLLAIDNSPSMVSEVSLKEITYSIPAEWSSEDVEAILNHYSMAYYSFRVVADLKSYEQVLVTDACSLLGQAAVAVALSMGNRVFATVASADQANWLKKAFPQIDVKDIVPYTNHNFGIIIRNSANGELPEVVFNLLEGDLFSSIFYNASWHSRILHFGKDDIRRNTTLGMRTFLKGVSIIPMSQQRISLASTSEKEQVRQLLEGGFASGIVKPLVPLNENATLNLEALYDRPTLKKIEDSNNAFIIKPGTPYLIIGSCGKSNDVEMNVAEWLIRKGATQLFFYQGKTTLKSHEKRIQLLEFQKHVEIKTLDESNFTCLINDVNSGRIHLEALFFIQMFCPSSPMDNRPKSLNSNNATDPTTNLMTPPLQRQLNPGEVGKYYLQEPVFTSPEHMVLVHLHDGKTDNDKEQMIVSEDWTKFCANFTIRIANSHQSKSTKKVKMIDIIGNIKPYMINQILNMVQPYVGKSTIIDICSVKSHSVRRSADRFSIKMENARNIGNITSDGSAQKLIFLPTNCPTNVKLPPVIFFVGFDEDALSVATRLSRDLIHPAFLAVSPPNSGSSFTRQAQGIIEELEKVTERKMCNLVGLSTACPVTLEVARLLEQRGSSAAVLLLDNPIHFLQNELQSDYILSNSFSNFVVELSATESKMKNCRISDAVSSLVNYKMNFKLKGPLTVLSSNESCDNFPYLQICHEVNVFKYDIDYESVLSSNEFKAMLNRFTLEPNIPLKNLHENVWYEFEEYCSIAKEYI